MTMDHRLPQFQLRRSSGEVVRLEDYSGQVMLVVNVASRCGLTPQYSSLEALYRRYAPQGFVILAFPSNDFRGQEPDSDEEIARFCSTEYDVTFPLFAKTAVTGENQHPFFAWLGASHPAYSHAETALRTRLRGKNLLAVVSGQPMWNFEKFLVGRNGKVVARFAPDIPPEDQIVIAAIERELAPS